MAKARRKATTTVQRPRRRWGRLVLRALLPVVVLVAAAATFMGLASTKPKLDRRAVVEKTWPVRARNVEIADYRPTIRLYGQAVAGRRVDLRALVAGEVIETAPRFSEGAPVGKGDLILRIDPFDYELRVSEARANLREGEARLAEIRARIDLEGELIQAARDQLQLSRRDYRRATELRKQGLVAQKGVDDKRIIVRDREQALRQRRAALKVERARADQQEAAVDRLKSALKRAERALAHTSLKAPFSGYLSGINAEKGRMLGLNDTVATLIDSERIDVRVTLSDEQFGRLKASGDAIIDRAVKVIWRTGETSIVYPARIRRVAAEVTAASGGVEVHARIEPAGRRVDLRPGTFVEVTVADRIYKNVARLPETALYGTQTVYAIVDQRLAARRIEVLGYAGDEILVRGDLASGQPVLTTRLAEAGDGLRVDIQER